MSKDIYRLSFYPPLIQSTKYSTIFEFDNIIIEVQNRFKKDIYSRINYDIRYYDANGKLLINYPNNKFRQITIFDANNAIIEKYTLSSNLEIKDDYMLLYCDDIALKIDDNIYDSDNFSYVKIQKLMVGENTYEIVLPKDEFDYPQERGHLAFVINKINNLIIIDFSDIGWLVKNSILIDTKFIDIYNKLLLERI